MATSLQSRLAKRQAKLKRKLSDNHLNNVGFDQKLLRLSVEKNKYGDETVTFTSFNFITGYIEFPNNKIPIFTTDGYEKGSTVYDLLPIKAYFKFEDEIEKGDIIIWKYMLDVDTTDYLLQVFRIAEHIGSFSNVLLYQEFNIAPYNFDIENYPEILSEIQDWEAEDL